MNQDSPDSKEKVLSFKYPLEDFGQYVQEDFWGSIASPPRVPCHQFCMMRIVYSLQAEFQFSLITNYEENRSPTDEGYLNFCGFVIKQNWK